MSKGKRQAECHPDRPNYGHGLCRRCWARSHTSSIAATCHPEAAHYAHGLCQPCYRLAHGPAYYKRNRERIRERQLAAYRSDPSWHEAYRIANRDRRNAAHRQWTKEHPEKGREYAARRRARLLGQFVESVDRGAVWTRDGGMCGICGRSTHPTRWVLDHIVPLSRGGSHSYANVQVAHPLCNQRKYNKPPPAEVVRWVA